MRQVAEPDQRVARPIGATVGAMTDEPTPTPEPTPPAAPHGHTPEYRGEPLDAERGPGLGCFWTQLIVLAILLVLTPMSVNWGWPPMVSAALLFIVILILLFSGQTVIFLLRLVAAERAEGRRVPRASATRTVGELEDEVAADELPHGYNPFPPKAADPGAAQEAAPGTGHDGAPGAASKPGPDTRGEPGPDTRGEAGPDTRGEAGPEGTQAPHDGVRE